MPLTSAAPDAALVTPTRTNTRSGEFTRGWMVLLAGTIGTGLGTTGLPFYSFGQFVRPIAQEFGWTRGALSGGVMCLMIGTVITSPFVGRAVDRFGVCWVAALSQIGLAIGFLCASLVGPSIFGFYAAWLTLSVLGSGTSPIVWTRAVAGWFERSRGLAFGIMLCGTGIVAIFAPATVNHLIASYGWRFAYRMLALTLVVVGLPTTLALLRDRGDQAGASASLAGSSLPEALKSSVFWRLAVAFFLISMVVGGLIVHLPAMLVDRGYSAAVAATTAGYLGYAIIVGRLSLGTLVDRYSPALVGALLISLSAFASVLLAQGMAPLAATLLLGLCAGAEVDLLAFLVSRLFGLKNYAQIYGCGISAFTAGAGVGPLLAGHSHDVAGSYNPALYGFAAAIVIAAAMIASLGGRVAASRALPYVP